MQKSFPKFLFLIVALYCYTSAFSQLDTAFWFAVPEVTESAGWGNFDRPIVVRISTLGQAATVTVSMPANISVAPKSISVSANSTGTIDITNWIDLVEARPPNTILNSGIKISSTAPVNVYYEVISGLNTSCQCSPEIFVLKGRNALGKDFLIPSQNILQNGTAYTPPSYNSFDIIASEDNTTLTITPKVAIVGHAAGVPFTIVLNKGQVLSNTATNFFQTNHLTGSKVIADKPVAITVKDDMIQGPACWDLGGDQIIPTDNLSTEYIALRGYLTSLTDNVFITAINNNTKVTINGVVYATLNATQTIAVPFSSETMYISASDKIYAFQLSGFGCEVGLCTIPSIICRGSSSVSFTRSSDADLILLITTKAGNEGSFLLNGVPIAASSFSYVPATSNQWMYARLTIPVTQLPALSAGRLTNSKGLFHLGIIHGSTSSGGARFGYFSDYATASLDVLQDNIRICGTNTVLDAGTGYNNYSWNTGDATQTIAVTQAGLYKITVTDRDGCLLSDSGYVKFDPPVSDSNIVELCQDQSYTLPWGPVVNAGGIYRDTLHYISGCDSIRRIVNLIVKPVKSETSNPVLCEGSSYSLSSGVTVNTTGTYYDTLHYASGCDSVRRTINLVMRPVASEVIDMDICEGSSYILSSGTIVNSAGTYFDTLHYILGCDSVRRIINLAIKAVTNKTDDITICEGTNFVLSSGAIVNTTGTYHDTLHYSSGCDSIRRTIHLTVTPVQSITTNPMICQGASYQLPWGEVVNTTGIYRDTLRYVRGCDSVRRIVNLEVRAASVSNVNASICGDAMYTLPWGVVVNSPGIYKDTVRTNAGCDSLIRSVNLEINPVPSVTISKSNDVDCMLATTKLQASGGMNYKWTPGESLSDSTIYNPLAFPSVTTLYHVSVTSAEGCSLKDSILVIVSKDSIQNGYLVPNAFTPNGDGNNDCFGVQTWGAVKDFEFSIYNRWGERLFYTKDPRQCWNGSYKGVMQASRVYVYQIKAKGLCGDIYRKGTFVLIR